MKSLISLGMLALVLLIIVLSACTRREIKTIVGPVPQVSNSVCLSAGCHGNSQLKKTVVTLSGTEEIIPLYVDSLRYQATIHGNQLCVSCHNDINAIGGAHGSVRKVYGGWARFSARQNVESITPPEPLRTRNYQTAASFSCVTCHAEQAAFLNSAHATIFKLRQAHVDVALTALAGKTIGENYEVGNCNRCHASCASCHFESEINRAASGSPLDYWDANQQSYPATGFNDKMSEFAMDWTVNVVSHDIRTSNYFTSDPDRVCEACHTGFNKPPAMAYYWLDPNHTIPDSIKATNVKRHPQLYELLISGNPSYRTGGTNIAHAQMSCAACHGGQKGDVHSLPGIDYNWTEKGDIQCIDCHNPAQAHAGGGGNITLHLDDTGIKVACIGCHTYGLARDFDPTSDAHEVFIDPITTEVRPVVWKNGEAIAWYAHNWQTFNMGAGVGDKSSDCAVKCHYPGNRVGASAW